MRNFLCNAFWVDLPRSAAVCNRSDVGAYSYGGGSAACSALADARPLAGLHAVSGIASAFAGGKNASYCYDLNGNLLAGDGRTVTWTAYDMVASVTRGARAVSFDYGPDRARFKRVDITPAGITTTVYAGGGSTEVITRPGGSSEMKTTIGDFAVVTTPTTTPGSASVTQYLHRDHLGSVDTITNAAGQVVQRMSFDSWGKRREVSWLTMTDGAIAAFDTSATTTRGFTGHEMIDPVGLVHMNGRVYDPEIGRFLSADPFVQETGNLQSWNRYSYVLNNPLSFTDPSGFFFSKLFKSIGRALGSLFRAIGAAVKKILQNPIFRAIINIVGCALPGVGQLACAAITGALSAAAGGSLADSLKAAAFAFVSMGIFKAVGPFLNSVAAQGLGGVIIKAGIHGIIGGALSVAQGGSFLQGFAGSAAGALGGYIAGESGFVGRYGDGDAGNILARALVSGAAGCAGALITGGKCAQAAVTAAFASLWNSDQGNHALAKAFLGKDAEITLLRHLQSNDKSSPWLGTVTVRYPDGSWGFIDLLRQASETIYEVKPFDGNDDGSRQLKTYSAASGYRIGDAAADIGTITGVPSQGPFAYLGARYSFSPLGGGAIGWTLDNPGQVALTVATGFVATIVGGYAASRGGGASLPRPAPVGR